MGSFGDTFLPALTGSLAQAGPAAIQGQVQGMEMMRQLALLDQQIKAAQLQNQQAERAMAQPRTPAFHNLGAGAFAIVDPATGLPTRVERPPQAPQHIVPLQPGQPFFNPSAGQFGAAPGQSLPKDLWSQRQRQHAMQTWGFDPSTQALSGPQAQELAKMGETWRQEEEAQKLKEKETAKIPPGYERSGGGLKPIQGGPADTKLQGQLNADTSRLQASGAAFDRLELAANELLQHPGLGGITGIRGSIPNVPGTPAADAAAKMETLKSQAAYSVLQEMRDNSKTGGALGQVSNYETNLLQNNLAALAHSQSYEQMQQGLRGIIKYAQDAKGRLQNAYNLKHGGGQSGFQPPVRPPAPAAPPTGRPQAGGKRVTIKSDEAYNRLPPGTVFVGPDGVTRRKP